MTYRGRTNPPGHSSRLLKWRDEAILDPPNTAQQKPSNNIFLPITRFLQGVKVIEKEISGD